jgi:hypothetical protein
MTVILPTKATDEIVLLPPGGFIFASRLSPGEVLIGPPKVSISVYSGFDPNPMAMLSGIASIVGAAVRQLFTGGVIGNIYQIVCGCSTSLGQYLEISAYLVVLANVSAPAVAAPGYILLPSGQAILLPGGAGVTLP